MRKQGYTKAVLKRTHEGEEDEDDDAIRRPTFHSYVTKTRPLARRRPAPSRRTSSRFAPGDLTLGSVFEPTTDRWLCITTFTTTRTRWRPSPSSASSWTPHPRHGPHPSPSASSPSSLSDCWPPPSSRLLQHSSVPSCPLYDASWRPLHLTSSRPLLLPDVSAVASRLRTLPD